MPQRGLCKKWLATRLQLNHTNGRLHYWRMSMEIRLVASTQGCTIIKTGSLRTEELYEEQYCREGATHASEIDKRRLASMSVYYYVYVE